MWRQCAKPQARRTADNSRRFGCDAPCRIAITRAAQRFGLDLGSIIARLADLPDDAAPKDWHRLNHSWQRGDRTTPASDSLWNF